MNGSDTVVRAPPDKPGKRDVADNEKAATYGFAARLGIIYKILNKGRDIAR